MRQEEEKKNLREKVGWKYERGDLIRLVSAE